MPDQTKTNAMRVLDAKKVPYRIAHYGDEDTFHSAEEVAALIDLPAAQVFKTLVALPAKGNGKPILAIVPGDHELDLKALASSAREKKVRMASYTEAESLTGLRVGGISALALLSKQWKTFLDESANEWPEIAVSAGQRGVNLIVPVKGLVKVCRARTAPISRQQE